MAHNPFESITTLALETVTGGLDDASGTPVTPDTQRDQFTTGGTIGGDKNERFTTGGRIGGSNDTFTTGGRIGGDNDTFTTGGRIPTGPSRPAAGSSDQREVASPEENTLWLAVWIRHDDHSVVSVSRPCAPRAPTSSRGSPSPYARCVSRCAASSAHDSAAICSRLLPAVAMPSRATASAPATRTMVVITNTPLKPIPRYA